MDVAPLLIGPWNAAFNPATVWRSTNTVSASQLLRQFFRFYAEFAAEVEALCPLMGGPLERAKLTDRLAGQQQLVRPEVWASFCDLVAADRVDPLVTDTALVVQDPIELNHNVARNLRQLGLDRFRQCCQQAATTPLARLFDEEALPKAKMKHEEEAAKAAMDRARSLADVATHTDPDRRLSPSRAAKRSSAEGSSLDGETAAKRARANDDLSTAARAMAQAAARAAVAAAAATVPKANGSAKSNGHVAGPVLSAATAAVGSESGKPKVPTGAASGKPNATTGSESGKPRATVSAASGVSSESDRLRRRLLSKFERTPSRVIPAPLAVAGRQPHTEAEWRRHAAAFARFLEEVLSGVMRFECHTVTFEGGGLTAGMDLVRGYSCVARLPTWNNRKAVTSQLVGRQKTLEFESEVTERALKMAGQPAPIRLAAFYCFLVLAGDGLEVRLYDGETAKAGKNCHTFLASFLQDLIKRQLYVALLDKDQLSEQW